MGILRVLRSEFGKFGIWKNLNFHPCGFVRFQGGVILVSHDERLIQLVCKELWVVKDGKIHSLEGGFLEYRKIVEEELAAQGC